MNDSGSQGHFCCASEHRFELLGIPGADESVFQDHLYDEVDYDDIGSGNKDKPLTQLVFFDGAKSFPFFSSTDADSYGK